MTNEIQLPLPDYVREAAREAARVVIAEHMKTCNIGALERRMQILEGRFNVLLGAIVGSGALGGTVGALILKMFGG